MSWIPLFLANTLCLFIPHGLTPSRSVLLRLCLFDVIITAAHTFFGRTLLKSQISVETLLLLLNHVEILARIE